MTLNRSGVYMPVFAEESGCLSSKKVPHPPVVTCPSPPPRPTSRLAVTDSSCAEDKSFIEEFFTVESKLGQGSFGDVFKCRCALSGREYAVKRSKRGWTSGGDRSRQLSIIQRIINIPRSPYVIRLHRAWEESGILYQQMELCSLSLAQYIESRVLPQAEVQDVFVDLLRALEHLERWRLVHLDVKPDNVFRGRGRFGVWKLGDFGICVEWGGEATTSTPADYTEGDSRYLAPEVMQGSVSPAADVFSLGLTILEVACSVDLPKSGPLWHQLRSGGRLPEPVPDATPTLLPILHSMLRPSPADRPTPTQLLASVQLSSARRRRRLVVTVSEVIRWMSGCFDWVIAVVMGGRVAPDFPPLPPTPFPLGAPPFASTPLLRSSARRRFPPATPLSHTRNLLKEFDAVG